MICVGTYVGAGATLVVGSVFKNMIASLLRRFPLLHAAARGANIHRIVSRQPVKTPLGFRFAGPSAMENGSFEPQETKLINQLLERVEVFVNIGANTGYYVCLARSRGTSSVVAIEPLEQNVQLLQRNIKANDWDDVEILPVGLGSKVNLLKLYGGGTAASFIPGWAGAHSEVYRLVPVTTLDNVLSNRFLGKRLLIVMDVEGFELQVLQGAILQLARNPAPIWFVEICMSEHQPNGVKINPAVRATFELFEKHGYRAQLASDEASEVRRENWLDWSEGRNLPSTHNFLFFR